MQRLRNQFQNYDPGFSSDLRNLMSSKFDNGQLFPPYVPFVGNKFSEGWLMLYSTAQNISFTGGIREMYQGNPNKLVDRLYYDFKMNTKYPSGSFSFHNVQVEPFKRGVTAALAGLALYIRNGLKIPLDEVHH